MGTTITCKVFVRNVFIVLFLAILVMLGILPASPAYASPLAQTYTITTTADDAVNNGNCTLREAISAANTNLAVDTCPAGSGSEVDIITLTSGQTYTLTATGDLNITDAAGLTIQADSDGAAIIAGTNNRIFDLADTASLILNKITVTGGNNVSQGAGIKVGDTTLAIASLTLNNSTVSNNTATSNNACGAGLYINSAGSSITINESTVAGNQCTDVISGNGGGIWMGEGTVTIRNSTFHGNTATNLGGGIFMNDGSLSIAFSTFSDNSASATNGNAIHRTGGTLSVTSSIIANSANTTDCFSTLSLGESISNTLIENNAAGTDACGSPSITSDPGLGALTDNGGPTQTMSITSASPAFNAATACSGSNSIDQRNFARPGGPACDLGSFEVDVNDAPVVDPATFAIDENSVNGTNAGTVTYTDPDSGQTHTFSIQAGNTGGAFAINAGTGQITVADSTAINFEATPTFSLTVRVTDDGTPSLFGEAAITINLNNANELPIITEGTSIGVTMSEDGSPVPFSLTLHVTDPDAGDTLTWSVSTPALHGAASASGTGLSKAIGYTPALNYNGSDSFVVQVSDGSHTDTITVNVTINPVNNPPTDIAISNTGIDENNIAGGPIGTLSTADPDDVNFTYSFCGGTDDASFQISGNSLQAAVVFDFETKSSYSVCIRSTDSGALGTDKTFVISINDRIDTATFADVPTSYWSWRYIESIYTAGVTGGCGTSPRIYCPLEPVTRAQMAIFILRGIHGSAYAPPPATGAVFTDVSDSYWAAAWIEQLAAEGITGGCASGTYCPDAVVTRDQMAVFLLRAKHGTAYTPPTATGTAFTDIPDSYWAAAWIEQLAAEGITGGCGGGNYCPTNPVTRDQMAVFLQKTFNLPLP